MSLLQQFSCIYDKYMWSVGNRRSNAGQREMDSPGWQWRESPGRELCLDMAASPCWSREIPLLWPLLLCLFFFFFLSRMLKWEADPYLSLICLVLMTFVFHAMPVASWGGVGLPHSCRKMECECALTYSWKLEVGQRSPLPWLYFWGMPSVSKDSSGTTPLANSQGKGSQSVSQSFCWAYLLLRPFIWWWDIALSLHG